MLAGTNLMLKFWVSVIEHANWITNRSPSCTIHNNKMPFELSANHCVIKLCNMKFHEDVTKDHIILSDNDEIDWVENAGMTRCWHWVECFREDEYGVNHSTMSPASNDKGTVIEEPLTTPIPPPTALILPRRSGCTRCPQGCPTGYPYGSVKIFPCSKLHIRMQIKIMQNLAIH